MAHFSSLMHDQPDRPLDRATYWIEYVIRHRGAPHLRSKARWLSMFQRGLFDVALVVAILTYFFVVLLARVIRFTSTALSALFRLLAITSNVTGKDLKQKHKTE